MTILKNYCDEILYEGTRLYWSPLDCHLDGSSAMMKIDAKHQRKDGYDDLVDKTIVEHDRVYLTTPDEPNIGAGRIFQGADEGARCRAGHGRWPQRREGRPPCARPPCDGRAGPRRE